MTDLKQRLLNLTPEKRALLATRVIGKESSPARQGRIPRRRPTDPCPVSFSQRRLWFLDQLEPGNTAYNVYRAVRLRGELNYDALEQSLNEIVRRHEVLRTTYPTVNDLPEQVISGSATLSLDLEDLASVPEPERNAKVVELATEEARRPFDLSRDLMLRGRLLRLGEREHVLLLTSHHIVVDGWSVGVLFKELAALYAAYSTGRSSPLPDPPIQFADFALWQNDLLQGEWLERHLNFWKQQLQGAPTVLELPTDRPRPAIETSRGARYFAQMPAVPLGDVKALCRTENATLFMALLAAFGVLLSHYTDQEDFLIGSPFANRDQPETEVLIGCFSNTLVFRVDLSGHPTFRQLLGRVREMAFGAYAHQSLPFEMLVRALNPKRDPSRMTLVQVNFRLVNAPLPPTQAAGLSLEFLEIDNLGCKFDLAFELYERPNGLAGFIEYNADLFDAETISWLSSDFERQLEILSKQPDVPVSDLNFQTRVGGKKPGSRRAGAAQLPDGRLGAVRRKSFTFSSVSPAGNGGAQNGSAVSPPASQGERTLRYDLRRATLRDSKFLYELRLLTMKQYISQIPGWSNEYQEAFLMDFDPPSHNIIIVNGEEVGALSVVDRPGEVYLANVHLLPQAQGKGLGSKIVRDALAQAHNRGLPLTAQVLKINRTSLHMFKKVGLKVCGETTERYLLTSEPPLFCSPHELKQNPEAKR